MDAKQIYLHRIKAIIAALQANLQTLPKGPKQERLALQLEQMERIVDCCFGDEKVS